MKRFNGGILPLLAVIFCVGFIFTFVRARAARVRLAISTSSEDAVLVKRDTEQSALLRIQHELAAARSLKTKDQTSVDSHPVTEKQAVSVFKAINDDPRIQNLKREARRAWIANTYAPLFNSLRLSHEAREALIQLKLVHEEQQADLKAVFLSQQASLSGVPVGDLLVKSDNEYHEGIKQLLGEGDAPKFYDFEESAPVRDLVSKIAGNASMAGTPFTRDQSEQLTQIITKMSESSPQDDRIPNVINWPAVDLQARTVLAPAQYISFITLETPGADSANPRALSHLNDSINAASQADSMANKEER